MPEVEHEELPPRPAPARLRQTRGAADRRRPSGRRRSPPRRDGCPGRSAVPPGASLPTRVVPSTSVCPTPILRSIQISVSSGSTPWMADPPDATGSSAAGKNAANAACEGPPGAAAGSPEAAPRTSAGWRWSHRNPRPRKEPIRRPGNVGGAELTPPAAGSRDSAIFSPAAPRHAAPQQQACKRQVPGGETRKSPAAQNQAAPSADTGPRRVRAPAAAGLPADRPSLRGRPRRRPRARAPVDRRHRIDEPPGAGSRCRGCERPRARPASTHSHAGSRRHRHAGAIRPAGPGAANAWMASPA